MLKRGFDLLLAAAAFLLLWPILAIVAVAIVLEDGRPALFSQIRIGRQFRPFLMWKFRTMQQAAAGDSITSSGDPRITRVGRFLRWTKLDELPQLWNVLRGDMSFVGPRPEIPEFVACFRARYEKVLTVRPGITDMASIEYVDEEEILARAADPLREYRERILPAKLAIAERYVARHSLPGDLSILLKTVFTVVRRPRR